MSKERHERVDTTGIQELDSYLDERLSITGGLMTKSEINKYSSDIKYEENKATRSDKLYELVQYKEFLYNTIQKGNTIIELSTDTLNNDYNNIWNMVFQSYLKVTENIYCIKSGDDVGYIDASPKRSKWVYVSSVVFIGAIAGFVSDLLQWLS